MRVAFDLGQKPMLKALNAFADAAADADIAVIYYSGHGLEMGGVNYLVPVDATLAADTDVQDETVTLERTMQALDGAKRLKLVILDACRTNPFLASIKSKSGHKAIGEKGLAPVEPAGADMLVAFAAKAGTPAYDGDGVNSPFAAALAKRLVAPGDDVELALRKVRDDVLAATHNRQEPFKYGSLGGSIIPLSKAVAAPRHQKSTRARRRCMWLLPRARSARSKISYAITNRRSGRHRARRAWAADEVSRNRAEAASDAGCAVRWRDDGLAGVARVGVLTGDEACALKRATFSRNARIALTWWWCPRVVHDGVAGQRAGALSGRGTAA